MSTISLPNGIRHFGVLNIAACIAHEAVAVGACAGLWVEGREAFGALQSELRLQCLRRAADKSDLVQFLIRYKEAAE